MKVLVLGAASLIGLCLYLFYTHQKLVPTKLPKIQSVDDIRALFPTTKAEIEERTTAAKAAADKALDAIYAVPKEKRTFDNTVRAYDTAYALFHIVSHVMETLTLVSPEELVRTAAQQALQKMQAYSIDNFGLNPRIYHAIADYVELLKDPTTEAREALTPEHKYFLDEIMRDFRRSGLQLPPKSSSVSGN